MTGTTTASRTKVARSSMVGSVLPTLATRSTIMNPKRERLPMPKGKYEARARFPSRGCTLIVDVDMEYGDEDVALVRAKRIVSEEFGKAVVELAEWSITKVDGVSKES